MERAAPRLPVRRGLCFRQPLPHELQTATPRPRSQTALRRRDRGAAQPAQFGKNLASRGARQQTRWRAFFVTQRRRCPGSSRQGGHRCRGQNGRASCLATGTSIRSRHRTRGPGYVTAEDRRRSRAHRRPSTWNGYDSRPCRSARRGAAKRRAGAATVGMRTYSAMSQTDDHAAARGSAASATASAPAGMRNGMAGSVTARHTASATSLAVVI